MALKMPKLTGSKTVMAAGDTNIGIPTTQVKMTQQASAVSYDPLASVSIMEQLRTASAAARMPRKLPLLGGTGAAITKSDELDGSCSW